MGILPTAITTTIYFSEYKPDCRMDRLQTEELKIKNAMKTKITNYETKQQINTEGFAMSSPDAFLP